MNYNEYIFLSYTIIAFLISMYLSKFTIFLSYVFGILFIYLGYLINIPYYSLSIVALVIIFMTFIIALKLFLYKGGVNNE